MPDFWRSESIAHSVILWSESIAHNVILCTMAKQKDHLRPELRSTKRQWQVLTRLNSKVASHVRQFSHNMNFANVKVVGVESNYQSRAFPLLEMRKTIVWRHNMAAFNSPEGTPTEIFNSQFFESSQFTLPAFPLHNNKEGIEEALCTRLWNMVVDCTRR